MGFFLLELKELVVDVGVCRNFKPHLLCHRPRPVLPQSVAFRTFSKKESSYFTVFSVNLLL